jgi:hypothetical protein
MNEQEIIEELDRSGQIASIRKNMCKVMPPLGHRVRTLHTQFTQLTEEEKNLIRPRLENALDKILIMVRKINHNFQEEEERNAYQDSLIHE